MSKRSADPPWRTKTNPIPQAQLPKANCQKPKNAKRTQSTPPAPSHRPNYTKRTQFHNANSQSPTANSQKIRNEPNFHRSGPVEAQKYETNPIPAHQVSHRPIFMRNEPNPSTAAIFPARPYPKYAKQTQFQPGPRPKYAKRTQSTNHEPPTTNYLSETNPIPRPTNSQPPKANSYFYETNPILAYQVSRRPLFQRNEPNYRSPHDPICETNPISARQKCETNPIPPRSQVLHFFLICRGVFHETNPIFTSLDANYL